MRWLHIRSAADDGMLQLGVRHQAARVHIQKPTADAAYRRAPTAADIESEWCSSAQWMRAARPGCVCRQPQLQSRKYRNIGGGGVTLVASGAQLFIQEAKMATSERRRMYVAGCAVRWNAEVRAVYGSDTTRAGAALMRTHMRPSRRRSQSPKRQLHCTNTTNVKHKRATNAAAAWRGCNSWNGRRA